MMIYIVSCNFDKKQSVSLIRKREEIAKVSFDIDKPFYIRKTDKFSIHKIESGVEYELPIGRYETFGVENKELNIDNSKERYKLESVEQELPSSISPSFALDIPKDNYTPKKGAVETYFKSSIKKVKYSDVSKIPQAKQRALKSYSPTKDIFKLLGSKTGLISLFK